MTKALCSCGFSGNLEELEVIIHQGVKNKLACPFCKRSAGLDFVVEVSKLDKPVKGPRQKDVDNNNITTEEHFELFKKCVMYWIRHFGLYGWDVQLLHQEDRDSLAFTRYNVPNRSITTVLAKNWGDRIVTDIEIDKTAFHEVGELLLMRMREIAESRFISDEETGEEIHNVIRILEHVIWEPKMKESR